VALDGEPITGVDDLVRLLNAERVGRDVAIAALRQGELITATVRPTELTPRAR
jgi:S1-C subfamily serine protease